MINYNVGRDLVGQHVRRSAQDLDEAWVAFASLVGSPRLLEAP